MRNRETNRGVMPDGRYRIGEASGGSQVSSSRSFQVEL